MNARDGAKHPLGLLADIAACLVFLSRLNFGISGIDRDRPTGHGAWALPVAGAFVGVVAGAAYAVATGFAFGPLLSAALALAAWAAITGARTEWGFAAAMDAVTGDPAADGRLGATGATALALAVILRVATIAALGAANVVMGSLMAAVALGAAATACVLYFAPPSGQDKPPSHNVLVAGVIAVVTSLLVLPFGGFAAVIIVTIVGVAVTAGLKRRVGGTTPVTLAAVQLACETAALLAIAASI